MYGNQDYPEVLFFSSSHCAPCKPVEEMLKRVNISMFGKRLRISKIDVENNSRLTKEYKITSLPTVIIGDKRLMVRITDEDLIDAILFTICTSIKLD